MQIFNARPSSPEGTHPNLDSSNTTETQQANPSQDLQNTPTTAAPLLSDGEEQSVSTPISRHEASLTCLAIELFR